MTNAFWTAVADTAARMGQQLCQCDAIAEAHRMDDCTPMHHRVSWHGQQVLKVATVADARRDYPPCPCARC